MNARIRSTIVLAAICSSLATLATAQGSSQPTPSYTPNYGNQAPLDPVISKSGPPMDGGRPLPPPVPTGQAPALPLNGGFVYTHNTTLQSMWITVYEPGRRIIGSGCIQANAHGKWALAPAGNRAAHEVRAEMTSTRDCSALPGNSHVTCDTRSPVAHNEVLALKGQPGKCLLEGDGPKTAPPAPTGAITTTNATGQFLWVTVYAAGRRTITSGCLKPREGKSWPVPDGPSFEVRGELTSTPDCKSLPGNQHVICDAAMPARLTFGYQLVSEQGKCRWEMKQDIRRP